ncbi:1-deoxy-D-xylulose-5-phosphate synthase [Kibdelosporangium persicum]|uniref:1-deoxy-D-xylulose-5-phosphate synthase n=1 Tax=Kibdelosporangium persicum TaxID=2698649 RepID=A0ABX2FJM0_9PSEU|nr:1-deoxy-D-xylulose-5-phosphate synthase [Kibdelosporangium persicum]NRN70963.1 1-deoxy-D-xylulose-5-phosphate synthase [Kibdelosporangium persicum]
MTSTEDREARELHVEVDEQTCISSGICAQRAGRFFRLADGISEPTTREVAHPDDIDEIRDAAGACPTGSIRVITTAEPDVSLLGSIREPRDLLPLTAGQLSQLAAEIRARLVGTVARIGGHLGSNLGVVELTIALHRVFRSPEDHIVFDTGHQIYVHKLLTGRQADFGTLRQEGGLSGYASRTESPHDLVENSHASTALAYADGLAKAAQLQGRADTAVVAVIGDGALTGGMAWEGLNSIAAAAERPVIIVLNDNGWSYLPTAGGLARHLAGLTASGGGDRNLFESLGFEYYGPVDGHDVELLERTFRAARAVRRPVVVHCVTRKGSGYHPAEGDEVERFHAPGLFDPATGVKMPSAGTSWTQVFGDELVAIGADRSDVVAVTAAMVHPTGLAGFAQAFPDRTFDVGIAEQHAIGSAAGLAMGGQHPVVAVYATFLNRAFDQLLMDVALHRLGVTVVLDRAGITGDDGASHNGVWDLSILQVVPGLRIAAPRDGARLRSSLREAVTISDAPTVVRYPKGRLPADLPAITTIGGLDVLTRGDAQDVLVVAVGVMAHVCVEAARMLSTRGIGATVVDPRWVKPLDEAVAGLARTHGLVAVVEDGVRVGGVGDAVTGLLRDSGVDTRVRVHGTARDFTGHGKRPAILAAMGLTASALADDIEAVLRRDRRVVR